MATGKSTKKRNSRRLQLLTTTCLLLAMAVPGTNVAAGNSHLLPSAFQPGDLILRRGEGFISDIARNFSATDKRFSHVGILVDYKSRAHVVHSVHEQAKGFDGVVIETLEDFLSEATDWAVYRLRLQKAQQRKLAVSALSYAHRKIPFDPQFDLSSQQSMYCTELIWRVTAEVASPNPIHAATLKAGIRYISIEDVYKQDNAMLIETMPP